MAIASDYPHPIIVNGYQCRNCDDVSDAKRNIDPGQGAFDVKATEDRIGAAFDARTFTLGGNLSNRAPSVPAVSTSSTLGRSIDRFA
jgi:hypothetical protein